MGRKYWCEFCDRSFPDLLATRKKHMHSQQHKILRKLHYDSFKDRHTLLQEAAAEGKTPCRRFNTTGDCPFGERCRYSHIALQQHPQQPQQPQQQHKIDMDVIHTWLEKWKEKRMEEAGSHVYRLPSDFPSVDQLSPSLRPNVGGGGGGGSGGGGESSWG